MAVSTELEYRFNFADNAVLSIFGMFWAADGVSIHFRFTGDGAGWNYAEVLVVIGLFFTINGVRPVLFQPNLEQLSPDVAGRGAGRCRGSG